MPLTYQPFAEVPEVTNLGKELRAQGGSLNDSTVVLLGGAVLFLLAFGLRGVFRLALLVVGGVVLRRALK